MEDYKLDVLNTRVGGLGSSDAKMLKQIAELGCVPQSAYKRLAVCKGLIPQEDLPPTLPMRVGDQIEMAIFKNLAATNPRCESNPLIVSKKYSRKNCKLLTHPDIRIQDNENKILTYVEIKASRYTFQVVRREYEAQLFAHWLHAQEEIESLGKGWKARVLLAHYSTFGLNLEEGVEFDPSRLTVKQVNLNKHLFNMNEAMDIVDAFLETFDTFYEGEEVPYTLLPSNVKEQFEDAMAKLRLIDDVQQKVETFKTKLFDFMSERGIKKISCDEFAFTVVPATKSVSFDSKRYMEDMHKKHPRKAKQIEEDYKKVSEKKGYLRISLPKKEKEN